MLPVLWTTFKRLEAPRSLDALPKVMATCSRQLSDCRKAAERSQPLVGRMCSAHLRWQTRGTLSAELSGFLERRRLPRPRTSRIVWRRRSGAKARCPPPNTSGLRPARLHFSSHGPGSTRGCPLENPIRGSDLRQRGPLHDRGFRSSTHGYLWASPPGLLGCFVHV